jgi:hypothetical protein
MNNSTTIFIDDNHTLSTSIGVTHTKNWIVLVLSFFSLFGIIGNYLVCCAIIRDKTLKTTTNYYVFSLALADLAVCILVLPVAISKDFYGYWFFYEWIWTCPLFIFLDVLLCTVSIYHLATVSILRFFVIQFPFKHAYFKSKRLTLSIIVFIWIISIIISSNILFISLFDLNSVLSQKQCYVSNDYFIIYGSIFSFVIPLLIMLIMFLLMARKLRRNLVNLERATVVGVGASEVYTTMNGLRRHARTYTSYKATSSSRESFKHNSIDSRIDSVGLVKRGRFSRLFIINAPDTTHLETQSEAKALQVLFLVFIIFLIAWVRNIS